MVWIVLLILVVIVGIGVALFYRRAQQVESELDATENGAPPPMFGATQGRIRRNTRLR